MEIGIIYQEEDFAIINKPPGVSVHGGPSVSGPTVTDFLLQKFPEVKDVGEDSARPGIVHRLDKDTSGIMVVARNQKAFFALKELFQKRQVEKTYWAIVCGKFKESEGIINLPIGRIVKNPLKRGVEEGSRKIRGAREAITQYKVLKEGEKYSLVEVHPKTGRMHQIRVHLGALHRPVACDGVYGGKNVCCPSAQAGPSVAGRQLLHARALSFIYPEGRKLQFEADVPEDFTIALSQII